MNNLFGTDGIRRTVGLSPLTLEELPRLAHALGSCIIKHYGSHARILVACDTRESASFIKSSLMSGLLLHPLAITDADILPTPAVAALMQKTKAYDIGLVISASHNPYYDNGIKLIDPIHGKISTVLEEEITHAFMVGKLPISYTNGGTVHNMPDAVQHYVTHMQSYFSHNFLKGITVLLDCAHGATFASAPRIFSLFGAHVITIANRPDGKNINDQCGALYPTTLQQAVIEHKAHIGFAFDGDGDRVIAVNQAGEIKNGDDLLMLLTQHSDFKKERGIVATIMSNHGLVYALAENNKKVIRCNVGDKAVYATLNTEHLLLGGEQSGHIIMRNYLPMGDGIYTALKVIETLLQTNNWSMHTFKPYPQIIVNIPVITKKDLQDPCIAQIITAYESQLQEGRMIIRYSGTENLLRIMIEHNYQDNAQVIIQQLSAELKHQFNR